MSCEEHSITVPQDIIIAILCRLPLKSLGRFQCVSKEWLSLLLEPHFINTHCKTLNKNHLVFWSNDDTSCSVPFHDLESVSPLPKLPFQSLICYGRLYASCNGLVLSYGSGSLKDVAIFNLTTKEYVKFEKSVTSREFITYNNAMYHYFFNRTGFGYDSLSDDYKVVSMYYFRCPSATPPFKIRMYVYSLRSVTWKQVSDSPYDHYGWKGRIRDRRPGVFVHGFLHWTTGTASDSTQVIAAFSLAEEKFISVVPSPDYLYNNVDILQSDDYCRLVAIAEKLAIFDVVKGDVWMMNEYGVQKSWTKIVAGGYYGILRSQPEVFYGNGKLMIMTKAPDDERLWGTKSEMWMYDLEEQTFCKSGDFNHLNLRLVISTCVESLISPKHAYPINYPEVQAEDGQATNFLIEIARFLRGNFIVVSVMSFYREK